MEYLHSNPPDAEAASRQPYVDVAKLRVIIVEDSAIIRARLSESLAEIPNVEIVGQVETEADALVACCGSRGGMRPCSTCSSSKARGSVC